MAFSYKRAITIDYTKCGTADSTHFPVYFSGHSSLATVSNGGHVQNASGYDIGFYSDSALTTKLPWERVSWSSSTGLGEWYIQLPTVSHTANTVFYVAYGDSSVTSDQSNASGVWDSNYKAVYHLGEASNPYKDSTSASRNSVGTQTTYPTQSTGKLGSAQSFASGNGFQIPQCFTTVPYDHTFFGLLKPSSGSYSIVLDTRGPNIGGALLFVNSSGQPLAYVDTVSGGTATTSPSSIVDGNYHAITGTYSSSSTTLSIYADGSLKNSATCTFAGTSGTFAGFNVGETIDKQTSSPGSIFDEVRISSIVRATSWILAESNNLMSPSSFYAVGSEISSAPAVTANNGFFRLM